MNVLTCTGRKEVWVDNQSSLRVAEYKAIRDEMQSITLARYTILAFAMAALAAILNLLRPSDTMKMNQAVFVAPIVLSTILFPSVLMTLTLSRHYHRLSTFNAVFWEGLLLQQEAFEKYKDEDPRHWAYTKPLASAYACLLAGAVVVPLILLWDFWGWGLCDWGVSNWAVAISTIFAGAINVWLIRKLWDASLTGKAREREKQIWKKIKDELLPKA